jgi:hypothetical protein
MSVRFWAAACALMAGAAWAQATVAPAADESAEAQLLKAWRMMQAGELAPAETQLKSLLAAQPRFRLAWLLYGDLLNLLSGNRGQLPVPADDPRVTDLRAELDRRLISRDLTVDAVPANVIFISGDAPRVVAVDLTQGRLFLLQKGDDGWQRAHDHYAGIGRQGMGKGKSGDLRTPVGVYRINGYLAGSSLPDLYGAGALTLDYPNGWDQVHKRGGHGIWIHGVPSDTYVRPPQSSEGCVTLANDDFESLRSSVAIGGTPVILADNIEWLFAEEAMAQQQEWLDRVENWRLAWLSGEAARLQEFYAEAPKRKGYTELEVDRINLFRYPGEDGMVLAQFRASRRLAGRWSDAPMEQYWRRDAGGAWKITLEKGW